ncbi:hypothetical protein HELRODRAFT_158532 [Helobdella robusta]|uniref:Olfactomedin-like domain-containing protein n=1 Tax=Helobdella robusta TaxID=6412 RepID=T1EMX4_HELRO|nr:hypothetical protein HELRODRAFT_158532 [Helobdella robusta]ESO12107.1 hypothetical protein HELRODRAFT_158532 [Helobdella robusta]
MLQLSQFNFSDCQVKIIGIPVYQRSTSNVYGSWHMDHCHSTQWTNYIWHTRGIKDKYVYLYESLQKFKLSDHIKKIDIPNYFYGTGNMIYNGSFIYHVENTNTVQKFDLFTNQIIAKINITDTFDDGNFLYPSKSAYFDMKVDDNGLWILFKKFRSFKILKVNIDNLKVQKMWSLPENSTDIQNSFIVCGNLYFINNVTVERTKIITYYDLYLEKFGTTNLQFNNPYGKTVMISYNPSKNNIFSWDNGYPLLHPVLI